jgi:hypothetical protein
VLRLTNEVILHRFDEADEAKVLTSISDECQREECDRCPGIFTVGMLAINRCSAGMCVTRSGLKEA